MTRRWLPLSSSAMNFVASAGIQWQVLMAVLLAVLLIVQYRLWLAEDGTRQTRALRIANQAQTEENAALNERNRALQADVMDLKSGLMAIEERARSEIGMVRPDETFYQILEQPAPPPKPSVTPAKPVAAMPRATGIAKPPATSVKPDAPKPAMTPAAPKPNVVKPLPKPLPAQPPAKSAEPQAAPQPLPKPAPPR